MKQLIMNITVKTVIAWVAAFFVVLPAAAQIIPLNHAHHTNFGVSTNAAMSLLSPYGNVGFSGRQQWVGMDGAPQSYAGSAHVGLGQLGATAGLTLRQDRIGLERHTEGSLFIAKSIRIAEQDYVGLSLNVGLVHFNGRYSGLDPMDPVFRDDVNEGDAVLGFGAIVYRPEIYYLGFSLPPFRARGVGAFGDTRYQFHDRYYVTGGMLFSIGEGLHLRPSVQLSYSRETGTHFDGSGMIFMKRIVGLGAGASSQGNLSALLRLNFSGFGIGYSYQFNANNEPMNRRITNSTHEVGLSFDFGGIQRLL